MSGATQTNKIRCSAPVLTRVYPTVQTLREALLAIAAGTDVSSQLQSALDGATGDLRTLLDCVRACTHLAGVPPLTQATELTRTRSMKDVRGHQRFRMHEGKGGGLYPAKSSCMLHALHPRSSSGSSTRSSRRTSPATTSSGAATCRCG
jgi:hypothetical protein